QRHRLNEREREKENELDRLRTQLTDEILEIKQDNERLYDEIKYFVL
ncbi:unnamed protein product, partial [Oikopleura dioica]